MDFFGKVAIVTGGTQGIGRAYASLLLEHGMKVCICDISDKSLNSFMDSLLEEQKQQIIFQQCDVASFSDFEGVFKKVISTFKRLDLVVNNAGILNEKNWKKMIEVNFIGVIHGIQLAFEYMGVNNGGTGGYVVCTGSNTGFESFDIGPIYAGCKHGVNGLAKGFGTPFHFEKTGVKVNAVCPGPVNTPLFHSFHSDSLDENKAKDLCEKVSPIQPETVAKALIKVLEDDENGALLRVDSEGMRYS